MVVNVTEKIQNTLRNFPIQVTNLAFSITLELSWYDLGDSKNTLDSSQGDIPPKKLLKTDVSYVESIDCAKSPYPPFYLTKVAGIADTHNTPDVAIGIKGKL